MSKVKEGFRWFINLGILGPKVEGTIKEDFFRWNKHMESFHSKVDPNRILLYYHGGAYSMGILNRITLVSGLADITGTTIYKKFDYD